MKSVIYFPWRRPNSLLEYQKNFDFDIRAMLDTNGVSLARFGEDISVLKVQNDKDLAVTDFDGLSENFETVTDKRSIELLNIINSSNKKLAVFWSGGIDSTVILSSIIKNWHKQDWGKIVVFLNDYSISEYPRFYHNFISSNFRCQFFTNHLPFPKIDQYVITTGYAADWLWKSVRSGDYELFYGHENCFNSWANEKDNFINFLVEFRKISKGNANYIVERIDVNLNSLDNPPETMDDVFWLLYYNFHWQQTYFSRYLKMFDEHNSKSLADYKNFYLPWYHSMGYQKWARASHTRYELNRTRFKDDKYAAKKYIHDILKDSFYFNFKTKIASRNNLLNHRFPTHIIFSDGTILDTAEQNYEELFLTYLL